MANALKGLGQMFGFGRPRVDKDLMAQENRARLREQAKAQDLEADGEAARQRSARGGRRAALASQLRETLG